MSEAGCVKVWDPVVRLLWGFAGTRYARFAEFLRGPHETFLYLKSFAARRRSSAR